jgi:hypothetical protein
VSSWRLVGWSTMTGWSTLASVRVAQVQLDSVLRGRDSLGRWCETLESHDVSGTRRGERQQQRGAVDLRICGARHDDVGRVEFTNIFLTTAA